MTKRNLLAGIATAAVLAAGLMSVPEAAKSQGKIKVPEGAKPITLPTKPTAVEQPPASQQTVADEDLSVTFRQTNTFVTAPVVVYDSKHNFVNGLTPIDFQLLDKGIPQVVTQDVQAHPISLVVAVQANSTVRQVLPTVQKVASLFGDLVAGETGEVAVIGFDHRIQVETGFTSDGGQIKDAFQKLKPGSEAMHLNDAAMEGVRMLKARSKDRKRVLLLICESRDQGSAVKVRDVLTEAEFANVVIYTVDMSHLLNQLTTKAEPNRPNPLPPEARTPLPMGTIQTGTTDAQINMGNYAPAIREIFTAVKAIFVPNPLEVFTQFTGGKEHGFKTQAGLEEAIAQIGEEIHSEYLLTYLPSNKLDAGYHDITVNVLRAAGLEVRTRSGYWIAPQN